MKIQHYCYTRNIKLDYGDFISPSNMSGNQIDFVNDKILSIIGDGESKFHIPKWVLIKFDNLIVWGWCGWNSLLSNTNFTDHVGRPVYGFFSIVISEYTTKNIKVPFDIAYFKQLYAERIAPYWSSQKIQVIPSTDFIAGNFNYVNATANEYVNMLNSNIFECKSLGNVDKEKIIAAALTLDEVSLLIDNDNIEQATNPAGSFMNCLTSALPVKVYPVKQKRITELFKKEEDMDKELKRNLEDAQSQISNLKLEIKNATKRLKKKDLLIKILLGLLSLLLLVVLYTHSDDTSIKSFGKNIIESASKVNAMDGQPTSENSINGKQDTMALQNFEDLHNQ